MMYRCMGGQALIESLIAALFLTPLFLCAVYLAELYRDGFSASLMNRELALAAIHNPSGGVDQSLSNSLQSLVMTPETMTGAIEGISITDISTDDAATVVERAAALILVPAIAAGSGNFDMPAWRARSVTTSLSFGSTESLGVPFDSPVLLEEQLFFFAGHGGATSSNQVRDRTAALSAAGSLALIAEPVTAVASVVSVIEPAFKRLCLGRIDPDIVPEDRLPASVSRSSDLRYRPC